MGLRGAPMDRDEVRKFCPLCRVGRGWGKTKPCGVGTKTPSFGPTPLPSLLVIIGSPFLCVHGTHHFLCVYHSNMSINMFWENFRYNTFSPIKFKHIAALNSIGEPNVLHKVLYLSFTRCFLCNTSVGSYSVLPPSPSPSFYVADLHIF